MTDTFTLADLQAMADADLNALAAELRGWNLTFGSIEIPLRASGTETVREYHWEGRDSNGEMGAIVADCDWKPATDRNQSGELLECATAQGAGFIIDRFGGSSRIACYQGKDCAWICAIPGNDAHAETIAFCAAMLAMKGRLK